MLLRAGAVTRVGPVIVNKLEKQSSSCENILRSAGMTTQQSAKQIAGTLCFFKFVDYIFA